MSNDTKEVKLPTFEWNDTMNNTGITAQEISTISLGDYSFSDCGDTITLSGITSSPSITIGSGTGSSYTLSSGSSISTISMTDPYEELTNRLEKLEAIIAEEKEIRDNCPAVRNAYDEYRFLLVLAKKNKSDLLTDS